MKNFLLLGSVHDPLQLNEVDMIDPQDNDDEVDNNSKDLNFELNFFEI